MNRAAEGIALIHQAIAIKPDDFDAHFDLAVVYMKTKQYEKAGRQLREASAIEPARAGEVDRALARLERLSESYT